MSSLINSHDVLTLEEAAGFLRISLHTVEELAAEGAIPGRQVGTEWRILRSALEDWLRGPNAKQTLLAQAGALADDETLPKILASIYAKRHRPESSNSAEG